MSEIIALRVWSWSRGLGLWRKLTVELTCQQLPHLKLARTAQLADHSAPLCFSRSGRDRLPAAFNSSCTLFYLFVCCLFSRLWSLFATLIFILGLLSMWSRRLEESTLQRHSSLSGRYSPDHFMCERFLNHVLISAHFLGLSYYLSDLHPPPLRPPPPSFLSPCGYLRRGMCRADHGARAPLMCGCRRPPSPVAPADITDNYSITTVKMQRCHTQSRSA